MKKNNFVISIFLAFLLTSCASTRIPIKVGDIPRAQEVSVQDEEYGQQVLYELTKTTPLDRNDHNINRVRDIVDRIARAANADRVPWNVFVLADNSVKNAAATRGNYVFVWTGMLESTTSDGELASVLAHEIGHVLARHTTPNPAEEANQMISGVAGNIAGTVLSQTGYGMVGSLADALITNSLNAFLVNPNSQRLEYEADQIGIFLMADAGYNPEDSINFWSRAKNDPAFGRGNLQFLSTHPSSEDRLKKLEKMLPEARRRYQDRGDMERRASRPESYRRTTRLSQQPDNYRYREKRY